MKKLSWGILSTANIAVKKVIPAMQSGKHCEINGIASRSLKNAELVAKELNIPRAYGSYKELLEDAQIEAVYIPLPNHLHVEWAIKCLEAGKHVLCEKPIALDSTQAEYLLRESKRFPKLKIMEAFMYRMHPQWIKTKKLVDKGAIGRLLHIESHFSYFNNDPKNVRNNPDIGGGGLMDIGCYNISLSRFIFGAEPSRVLGHLEYDPVLHIDRKTSGILDFGDGTSSFTCSTQMTPYQSVRIFGTRGQIEIEIPFNAPPNKSCRIFLTKEERTSEITFDQVDQYTLQGDQFALAVLQDHTVLTPLMDGILNMKVIDALKKSHDSNNWMKME